MTEKSNALDHHGFPLVLFDGANADEIVAAINRGLDACAQRACPGCSREPSCTQEQSNV